MEQFNLKTTEHAFSIIGIQTRTSNAKEMAGAANIANLWQRFHTEQIFSKIPDLVDQNIYGVYHDYESDMNGEYTLTAGVKVKSNAPVPAGYYKIDIPQHKYAKFTSDQGAMPQVVIEAWQKIWNTNLNRSYTFDYELYDHRCVDMVNSQIDVFIAIKD
jgi:predicted transcriptional regulator YdeE